MTELSKEEVDKIRENIKTLLAKPDFSNLSTVGDETFDLYEGQERVGRSETPILEMDETTQFALDRYTTARDDLFARHPMFSNPVSIYRQALLTYRTYMTDAIGAISFDGDFIYLSPDWFSNRAFEEIKFTVAWMGFLIARGHHEKALARKDEEGFSNYHWNLAANLLINRVMIDAKAGVLPPVACFITSIGNELNADTTIEEVYDLIRPKSKLDLNKMLFPLRDWSNWIDYDDLAIIDKQAETSE